MPDSDQYLPLKAHEYSLQEDTGLDESKDPLLAHVNARNPSSHSPKWMKCASIAFSAFAIVSAFTVHFASKNFTARPRDARGLRHPDLYPGIGIINSFKEKAPALWFPGPIVRANRGSPDEVFTRSPQVLITDQDSMFYQWTIRKSRFTDCYIRAMVPTTEALVTGNKSYSAFGDISALEVWNVTFPGRLNNISWNTRPKRIAQLGTLNFTSEPREDGWELHDPNPRFPCSKGTYTIEVACSACRLEFIQEMTKPPIGFELQIIG